MKRRLNVLACLCVLLTVLTFLVLKAGVVKAAPTTAATPSACGAWSIIPSANIKNTPYGEALTATATVSANDVWSVGFYTSTSGFQTLTEHWNGSKWSIVASPNVGSGENYLSGVAAISSNDVWAVGNYVDSKGISYTLAEHWDGTHWSVVKTPNPVNSGYSDLLAVTEIASNNVWAVGFYQPSTGNTALIEHWNGTKWSISSSPFIGAILKSVSASTANDVWTVGESYGSFGKLMTLIEHWNGSQWSIVSSPNNGRKNYLNGVTALSAKNAWAVGIYVNNNTNQTSIEHWNGTNWSIVASPNVGPYDNGLLSVAAVSSSNIWAVGNYVTNTTNHTQALTEQWNGSSWQVVATPKPRSGGTNYLFSVSVIPGTSMLWSAGGVELPGQDNLTQTLTEYYC